MSQLRTAKAGDRGAFPGSTFVINGEVPEAQCSEALIEADDAFTTGGPTFKLTDPGKFIGVDLTGKTCTITANVGGNTGDFVIANNTNDILVFAGNPGDGNPTTYYIQNGGALIITRDVQSFGEFIHAAGFAHTIKGGQLYTNTPSGQLQPACSILFDPQT